jgi:hypothetical protein
MEGEGTKQADKKKKGKNETEKTQRKMERDENKKNKMDNNGTCLSQYRRCLNW